MTHLNKKYAAVIVETRPLENLNDIVYNDHLFKLTDKIKNKIDESWDLVFFGSKKSVSSLERFTDNRTVSTYEIGLIETYGMNEEEYNRILTHGHPFEKTLSSRYSFWHLLEKYHRVLIFQHDSEILKADPIALEKFLQYDYVGAPWQFQEHGGNGGLSIRNPKAMLEVIKQEPYLMHVHGNEDVYFSNIMQQNPDKYNLAPREVCEDFACESIFKLGTWGIHAIDKYLTKEQCTEIRSQYNNQ